MENFIMSENLEKMSGRIVDVDDSTILWSTTYYDFYKDFAPHIGLDDSFNVGSLTEGRWNNTKAAQFIGSLICNRAKQEIYLVDLQSCLRFSVEGDEDWEYFKEWLDAGYKWLAVDGNNRTISITKFFEDNIEMIVGESFEVKVDGKKTKFKIKKGENVWSKFPEELKKVVMRQRLKVNIIVEGTKGYIVSIFRNVNDGMEFNSQEKRNSELTPVSPVIREIGKKYDYTLAPKLCISPKGIIRKNFHELVISCGVYYVNQEHPVTINSTAQDKEYKKNSKLEMKLKAFSKEICECFDALLEVSIPYKQFKKVNVMNLWMFWLWLGRKNYKINNKKELLEWFIETELKRRNNDDIILKKEKNSYTYGGLNTDGANELVKRLEEIVKDFKKSNLLEKQIVNSVDPNRLYSHSQKLQLYVKQQGEDGISRCPITDKIIDPKDVLDSTKWQADHIEEHTGGGKTTVENGQLICAEAHRKKTAKFNSERTQPTLCPA